MNEGEQEYNKIISDASHVLKLDNFGDIKLVYPSIRESKSFLRLISGLEHMYSEFKDESDQSKKVQDYFIENILPLIIDYVEFCHKKQNKIDLTEDQLITLEKDIFSNFQGIMESLLAFSNDALGDTKKKQ